jgi:hypothetical protein
MQKVGQGRLSRRLKTPQRVSPDISSRSGVTATAEIGVLPDVFRSSFD